MKLITILNRLLTENTKVSLDSREIDPMIKIYQKFPDVFITLTPDTSTKVLGTTAPYLVKDAEKYEVVGGKQKSVKRSTLTLDYLETGYLIKTRDDSVKTISRGVYTKDKTPTIMWPTSVATTNLHRLETNFLKILDFFDKNERLFEKHGIYKANHILLQSKSNPLMLMVANIDLTETFNK